VDSAPVRSDFPNTYIEIMGPVSDDVGWLNAGAQIIIHGNASNGVANGMAQGKVYVGGSIGARGMTMTKHNPRFDPPELWVLGSVGDYFGEFMAGAFQSSAVLKPRLLTIFWDIVLLWAWSAAKYFFAALRRIQPCGLKDCAC